MGKTRKILVTGSGGFVFGNFIRQAFYSKKPYNISSIDMVRESHIIHNIYVNADHQFYPADIKNQHILHVIFQKERPDIVVHGAAESVGSALPANNVVGTQNVIDECLDSGAKLIYISTDEVYAPLEPYQNAWTEDGALDPRTLYSATKASGELLVKAAASTHGLKYAIVRPSACYGPWQTKDRFIPSIISSVLNRRGINIRGTGQQMTDWMHVFDLCKAIFQIIDTGVNNNIYNVTSNQEFMSLEVAQIVCNVLGEGHDLIKHVESEPGCDLRFAMTNDKIKSLGWAPDFKFRDGIKETCQWYVTNKYVLDL